jgi:copper(I)-binding protein
VHFSNHDVIVRFRHPPMLGASSSTYQSEATEFDMLRAILVAGFLVVGATTIGFAQTMTSAPITVERAWARATPGTITTGGAYMIVIDHGTAPDRLIGVATPIAGKAEVHETTNENGVMKMRMVDGVTVEPGKSLELKPGGYHVMMTDLKQPLKEGDSFPLTLTFEKAGSIAVTVKVGKVGAMAPTQDAPAAMPGMKM